MNVRITSSSVALELSIGTAGWDILVRAILVLIKCSESLSVRGSVAYDPLSDHTCESSHGKGPRNPAESIYIPH